MPSAMKSRVLAATALFGWLAAATAHPAAQGVSPVLTYPANGATNVDLSQPMQWTSVPNVQAYYLYVGTTLGAKDVVDSGETLQTSYSVAGQVPANQTLYARIWAKADGVWRYTDSTFRAASVAPLTATLTFPVNGATNVDLSQPMQWTSVPNVQAYYLYVGTTPGAKDVVNSGEILQTSYLVPGQVPANQTLYARLWTKAGGVWRYTDSTFSAASVAPLTATLTFPVNGATSVDLSQPMQWTSVPNVQAYYLYVGTTPGAKDVVNSGETLQTSYLVGGQVPANQTLYARLWARAGGVWRYTDSTFSAATVAQLTPTLTYPLNGATNVDLSQPMQWTSVPNVQAYYLSVGTTPGARDVVNSGEIQQTSYVVPDNVPADQILYARIFAKVGGVWRYSDSSFSALPVVATLIYPADGSANVDRSRSARWSSVQSAQVYYLYVGTTLGAKDLIDSDEIQQTNYPISRVPTGQVVFARLWTKTAGFWRYRDSTFSALPIAPEFLYPLDGATGVDLTTPFRWTAAIGAQAYRLSVGASPGGGELADSGEIAGMSYLAQGLPSAGILYARVWAKVDGAWARHSDIAFTPEASGQPSEIVVPVDGTTTFDTVQPFQWSEAPIARGYRLTIGTAPGGSDLHDSGEIDVTQRFVPALPAGLPLFGRLQTKIGGQWHARDFSFVVTGNRVSAAANMKAALWATDFVRNMASDDRRPFGWADLWQTVEPRYDAGSSDFAAELLRVLADVNIGTATRLLDVSFTATQSAPHTLVELFDQSSARWQLLDPTFNLSAKRSDGIWATAADLSQATNASNWGAVAYIFLGAAADAYVQSYYLDYPLLFLNVYQAGDPFVVGQGNSPLPYLQLLSVPASGAGDAYVIRCMGAASAAVVIDGISTQAACDGVDSTSAAFYAFTVAAPDGAEPSFQVYRALRFVF